MVFQNLTGKLSPADAVPFVGHQIPAFLPVMLQSHTAQISPRALLCLKLHKMPYILFSEGERQCVRRFKTVFFERAKVQPCAQNLQFADGRHPLRHQIKLFSEL